jgi:hypothetical protein
MPAAALLLLVPFLSQESCPNCLHRGVLPCKAHLEVPPEEEEPSPGNPIAYCSWAAACEKCAGTLWVDCGRCAHGERTDAVEERRRLIASWLEPNSLERAIGRSVPRLDTERFALVVAVPDLPDGARRMKAHVLAHRLARDLEHVAAKVTEHYAMTPRDYRCRMRMWIWDTLEDHRLAMEKFLGTITTGDFKLLGRDPVFSVWDEPTNFDTVEKVRMLFAHNGAHMLLSNAFQPMWVGDIGGGWMDAGIGHWYEYELFGRTVNYCFEEATLPDGYEDGRWRAPVRRRLEREKEPCLPRLLPQRTGQMVAADHALCWSFYDYLLAAHPGKVRPILADLKQKKPAREVLAAQLGLDVFQVEEAWRAWVSAAYPLKGDQAKPAAEPGKGRKK